MIDHFYNWFILQSPILQALLGGLFTWILTALGAGLVFIFKSSEENFWIVHWVLLAG